MEGQGEGGGGEGRVGGKEGRGGREPGGGAEGNRQGGEDRDGAGSGRGAFETSIAVQGSGVWSDRWRLGDRRLAEGRQGAVHGEPGRNRGVKLPSEHRADVLQGLRTEVAPVLAGGPGGRHLKVPMPRRVREFGESTHPVQDGGLVVVPQHHGRSVTPVPCVGVYPR